ncbi:MAG TPA: tetratricopeptide repeat protein [bacterium]
MGPFARTALTALTVLGLVGLAAARATAAVPPFDLTKIPLTEAAFTRSIQVYQKAAAANPRDAEAHYWLGVAYWEASLQHRNLLIPYGDGYLDKSLAELERAVSIDDNHFAAWQLLAAAYPTRGSSQLFGLGGLVGGLSDDQKGWRAAEKLIILAQKQGIAYGGAPQPKGGGRVAPSSPPAAPSQTAPPPPTTAPPNPTTGPTGTTAPTSPTGPAGQPGPAPGPAGSTGPTKKKFNPADYYVIGDQDTKLLYQYPCSSLPAIEHPAFFLIKWQAFDRGYKPATICPPP